MLAHDEPWTHGRAIERTAHLVAKERGAIRIETALREVDAHSRLLYPPMAAPTGRTKVATETPTLKVGDAAPDFALRSHDGRDISLAALRGQRVVVAFFAFAFTNT